MLVIIQAKAEYLEITLLTSKIMLFKCQLY